MNRVSRLDPARSLGRFLTVLAATALGPLSCGGGPTDPTNGKGLDLEAVPFEALGSAKVMFQRFANGGNTDAVYLIDAGNRRSTQVLKNARSVVFGPAIAPSGNQVAWLRWTDLATAYDVYVTDLSGANPQLLYAAGGNAEGPPSWSTDGTGVVFPVFDFQADWGIFMSTIAASATVPLVRFASSPGGGVNCPATFRSLDTGLVSRSVHGGLAMVCNRDIYASADSTAGLRSRYQPSPPLDRVYAPTWSPDGHSIAFLHLEFVGGDLVLKETRLLLVEEQSGAVRTLATIPGSGKVQWRTANPFSLCWLPGGARIVFNAPSTGVTETEPMRANLYVVGADGQGLTKLTTRPDAFDHSVSCSH